MKPDWEELADDMEGKKLLVGDVDCTDEKKGAPLCERFGVEGYPTLMYFNPPDDEGEKYEGGRTLAELKKFAKTLGPACTAGTLSKCSAKQLEELQPYMDKGEETLLEELASLKSELAAAEAAHEAVMESVQAQYKESQARVDAAKEQLGKEIKLRKAALPPASKAPKAEADAEAAKKDEV